jgi:mono/diheme cytochrome c family protein
MDLKRLLKLGAIGAVALFLLAQVVPYGRAHGNPPVTQAAKWPVGPGRQLAEQSCYDCHSNLTKWRWYSDVAPVSWLVQHDVEEGRGSLDFSEWNRGQASRSEVVQKVLGGDMPPRQYTLVHPGTSLSTAEKRQLAAALARLYATDPPPPGGGSSG